MPPTTKAQATSPGTVQTDGEGPASGSQGTPTGEYICRNSRTARPCSRVARHSGSTTAKPTVVHLSSKNGEYLHQRMPPGPQTAAVQADAGQRQVHTRSSLASPY